MKTFMKSGIVFLDVHMIVAIVAIGIFAGCIMCNKTIAERQSEIELSNDVNGLIEIATLARPYGEPDYGEGAYPMWEGIAAVKRIDSLHEEHALDRVLWDARSPQVYYGLKNTRPDMYASAMKEIEEISVSTETNKLLQIAMCAAMYDDRGSVRLACPISHGLRAVRRLEELDATNQLQCASSLALSTLIRKAADKKGGL